MSYIALYRKWRPTVFDDIVGQENIVKVLKNQTLNNRVAHAYLFSGGRGTGKTSTAKILARAVNCLSPKGGNPCNTCDVCQGIISGTIMDVVEIDAASNNSVDDVRLIRDEVFYMPSVCKFRVYIIDEVHMLSIGAFNALLKILEEPPKHVVFILATTEAHKLPATILSRCQRFEFRQISIENIVVRLQKIAEESNAEADKDAMEVIARSADGALRDAISILDQCMDGTGRITKEIVTDVIGLPKEDIICQIITAVAEKDFESCIEIIDRLAKNGKDLVQFTAVLVRVFRDIMVYKTAGKKDGTYMVLREQKKLNEFSAKFECLRLTELVEGFSELEASLKRASMPRVVIEVGMLKLCKDIKIKTDSAIEERLSRLEENLSKEKKPDVEKLPPQAKPERREQIHVADESKAGAKEQVDSQQTDTGDYFDRWEEVISDLKNSGRMVLYANLAGTKAKQTDDKTIVVLLGKNSSEFKKTVIMKAENLALLKNVLKKITGQEYNIKCMSDGKKAKEPDAQIPESTRVEELAKKFNIPINVIEE